MASSERDRVHQAMRKTAMGNSAGQNLEWDPRTKRIRVMNGSDPDRGALEITPSDMEHFGQRGGVE